MQAGGVDREQVVADALRDPMLGRFVRPGTSVLLWDSRAERVVLAAGSTVVAEPDEETRGRLAELASGAAPDEGFRVERLRLGAPERQPWACRRVGLGVDVGLLLVHTATGERYPQATDTPPRFTDVIRRGSARFTWQSDGAGIVVAVSPELAAVVGAASGAVVGLDLPTLVRSRLEGAEARLASALESQQSWSGIRARWLIPEAEASVPVELSAMPVRRAGADFAGYRGFGILRAAGIAALPTAAAGRRTAAGPDTTGKVTTMSGSSAALTPSERDAFGEIARALSADAMVSAGRNEDISLPGPAGADQEDTRALLDALPVAAVVLRDADPLHANPRLLSMAGCADLPELVAADGLAALLSGGAAVTRALIEWAGAPATLLTILPAPEPGAGGAAGDARSLLDANAALAVAADAALVVDEIGRIRGANPAAEALFGRSGRDLAGELFSGLIRAEDHLEAFSALKEARLGSEGEIAERQVRLLAGPNGQDPYVMRVGRVLGQAGRPIYPATFHDGALRRQQEAAARESARVAAEASASQVRFLARVSHEIRTPLNAIIGFTDLMLSERFGPIRNERYAAYVRDIQVSGQHVLSLVNDLLDLAKATSGGSDLDPGQLDLNAVAQQGVDLTLPLASRERAILRTSLTPGLPAIVADERSIRQVVLNLLSNAIRFTGPGGQVILSTAAGDEGQVTLRIRDTGPGMSSDEIEAALTPFRQVASRRRSDGTGLGLPLSKALVEANGGSFRIGGAQGHGTLVEVKLPTAPPQRQPVLSRTG